MMKKTIIALGLMLAALAFTQCTRKEEIEIIRKPGLNAIFTDLYAEYGQMRNSGGTRISTTPDGKVSWDENDELTVFIVPAGTANDWVNYKYVAGETAGTANIFTSDPANPSLPSASAYDWYVMSPYDTDVKDPMGGASSATAFSIGNQTQDFDNPTAHLTAVDIMTGVVKDVPAGQMPSVKLEHKGTLMKFTIINSKNKSITLQSVEFEAPESVCLSGTFSMDFDKNGTLSPKTSSNKTMLTIENARPIAPYGSYDLYVMMPPFTLKANDRFTVTVQSDAGVFTKTSEMAQNITFAAGTMNTATVAVSGSVPVAFTDLQIYGFYKFLSNGSALEIIYQKYIRQYTFVKKSSSGNSFRIIEPADKYSIIDQIPSVLNLNQAVQLIFTQNFSDRISETHQINANVVKMEKDTVWLYDNTLNEGIIIKIEE